MQKKKKVRGFGLRVEGSGFQGVGFTMTHMVATENDIMIVQTNSSWKFSGCLVWGSSGLGCGVVIERLGIFAPVNLLYL